MSDEVPAAGETAPHDVLRRRVIVRGRVQGVFFRDSCRRQASAAGVAGWVRNRSDGTVEAVFEGAPEEVEAMVSWCWAGPPSAHVDHVDEQHEAAEGLTEFSVAG